MTKMKTKKATKEEMRAEALERIKLLGLCKEAVELFEKGEVLYSERLAKECDGILSKIEYDDVVLKAVKDYEERTGYAVYHCQLTHCTFGDLLTLLYVGDKKSEWKQCKEDLTAVQTAGDGTNFFSVFAFVANLDAEELSEYGYVGIMPMNGGITRVY